MSMSETPKYLVDGEPVPEAAPLKVDDMKPTLETGTATTEAVTETVAAPQEVTPVKKKKFGMRSAALMVSRTMKSTQCDLKIVIGGEDGEEPVTRWYQSATMAEHSVYVDTMIESFMNENASKPYEISFPDIDEETWDLMMKYLDPVESRDMMAKDVLIVGEYYDHYDFPQGRKLCDKVLQEYFEGERSHEPEMDVEMLVDAVALSYKAHLLNAYEVGNQFVKEKLMSYKEKTYSAAPEVFTIPENDSPPDASPKRKNPFRSNRS